MPTKPRNTPRVPPAAAAWHRAGGDAEARLGVLETAHGAIRTPAFAPVATRGALKGVSTDDLPPDGFDLLLANTYHLMVRPGVDTVAALGGVRRMLHWNGPVLTDSGGFQIFSLAGLRELDRDGVTIRNHVDGSPLRLTPENVVAAQDRLGSTIAMVLDVCPALPADPAEIERAVSTTTRWAERSRALPRRADMALFAIVQGGLDAALRQRSARELVALDYDGYAIGGLSVGESAEDMYTTLDATVPHLPANKVRYLMGVGRPDNIVEAVARGIDLFDCVLPTRNARNGKLLTRDGFLNIQRSEYQADTSPVEADCRCRTCRTASRGLLRHLFKTGELNYFRLATIHNLHFMATLMADIRHALAEGGFADLRARVLAGYGSGSALQAATGD